MTISTLILLMVLFPLAGTLFNFFLGDALMKHRAHFPALIASFASWVCAIFLFTKVSSDQSYTVFLFNWISFGTLDASFQLYLDSLSLFLCLTVTTAAFFIHLFSVGYMDGEEGYARFFTELNFFLFSMLMLLLSENLLMLFVFWEAVGLCSYLLIGFYYEKESASAAAMKAFLVNRIGDVGFVIGLILFFINFGTLSVPEASHWLSLHTISFPLATLISALLLMGAVGKSAQFPLYMWLPDAMEGPTPVSALIHAATMVTAGVYLLARVGFLFSLAAASTGEVVALLGGITALGGALVAISENDLKRILAYSTVSQLGYMFVAMGVGAPLAGIFHLYTHAFFKALLFLCAGAVMHALHGELNIWKMGGLMKRLPVVSWCFLFGALALAGIPPFAGFWSKDSIVEAALLSPLRFGSVAGFLALLAVPVTGFYVGRVFRIAFTGQAENEKSLHAPSLGMKISLMALALGAVFCGLIQTPWGTFLESYLAPSLHHFSYYVIHGESEAMALQVSLLSTLLALLGLGSGWYLYGQKNPLRKKWDLAFEFPHRVNKILVEGLYEKIFLGSLRRFSVWMDRHMEKNFLEGKIIGSCVEVTDYCGRYLSRFHTGVLQNGLLLFLFGLIFSAAILLLPLGRWLFP